MIYLIGIHHELQHTGTPWSDSPPSVEETRYEFGAYLENKALELRPRLIAEELLEITLNKRNAQSIAKSVACKLGIEHRLCDMEPDVRNQAGLVLFDLTSEEDKKSREVREAYRLKHIEDRIDSTILFICGALHDESFGSLLRSNGCNTDVLCDYFGREIYT